MVVANGLARALIQLIAGALRLYPYPIMLLIASSLSRICAFFRLPINQTAMSDSANSRKRFRMPKKDELPFFYQIPVLFGG